MSLVTFLFIVVGVESVVLIFLFTMLYLGNRVGPRLW